MNQDKYKSKLKVSDPSAGATVEDLRNHDEAFFDEISVWIDRLCNFTVTCKHKKTARALFMILGSSNFIKEAIYQCCDEDNPYSANILFRSLLEHFLRHTYIFSIALREKNDRIGAEFYRYCDMGENLDYIRALSKTKVIFTGEEDDSNSIELLAKFNPDFKNITVKEIRDKSLQFNYKMIIEWIISNQPRMKDVNPNLYENLIPDYSELSSFVHGGPYAEKYSLRISKLKDRSEILYNIYQKAFNLATIEKLQTFMFTLIYTKEFSEAIKVCLRYVPV